MAPSLFSAQFIECAHHLARLHALIRSDRGDFTEADELRDFMDVLWGRLSDQESHWIRDLSADLNTLGRSSTSDQIARLDDSIRRKLMETEASGDWEGLRAEALCHPEAFPEHAVAFIRGRRWEALDDPDSSIIFLEEATRIAPGITLYGASYVLSKLYLSINSFLTEPTGIGVVRKEIQRMRAEAYMIGTPAA